jgi:hypothetical protein
VLSSRRILVVDDDPASCELVAYFLYRRARERRLGR